ncbi:nicotinate (nicotinamide) nucleotide adenylyltransferase [Candidatus Parcubacteria bacterium]|nr:nicotinate (nicotinamide) nucleotide adenylyltransferase [Candidatus Parcubacteria bacterium]
MAKKIGILGGAFNPPTFAHLKIAEKAKKILKLDKIIFIPYGKAPRKKKDLALAKDRFEMTKLLIEGKRGFEIEDYEIKKKGPAFTIETINYLKRKYKGAEIFWIIGEDSFREMIEGKWKGGLKVLDLARFVVFQRKNHPFSLENLPKKFKKREKVAKEKVIFIKTNIPISSSEIREKIKKKEKIDKFLPKKVKEYIEKKGLYAK